MAVSRILGVLSLVGALALLSNALPFSSRHRGPLADLLVDALDGVRLLDLATRRNMVLLCHAILLVLLGDAGILGLARRRRRQSSVGGYYSAAPPVVVVDQRQRLAVAVAAEDVVVATKEIVLLEKEKQPHSSSYLHLHAAEPDHPAAASMDRALVLADKKQEEEEDGEDAAPAAEEEEEDEEDVDEMNRRFEAFIAATKEKMRLEALHPHNTALLAS